MDIKTSYNIYVKHPSDCSKDELDDFSTLVREGGQVSTRGLQGRIGQARCLAFAYCGDEFVGIAALKIPGYSHRQRIFRNSRSFESAQKYAFELGWCYTKPQYEGRGICRKCVRKLLRIDPDQNIFSTTASDRMQTILKNFGFILSGQPYGSDLHFKRLIYLYVLNRKELI